MADADNRSGALLERYAEFYEEVARIKLALQQGRLPLYLAGGKEAVSANGNELAAMVSQRLAQRLLEQYRRVREGATRAEVEAYRSAQYVMVAQADELFILDLEWAGREAWEGCLLERTLFRSGSAGRDFFVLLDRLLASRARDALQEELAAVFLMALQLGFQGQHRGARGATALQGYRKRLLQFIGAAAPARGGAQPAFAQAYRYRLSEPLGQRLAPLRPWYFAGAVAAALYLFISTLVWFAAMQRLYGVLGG